MNVQFDPTSFVADPELILELEKIATPVECGNGRVLFEQGERPAGLYLLRAGKATMTLGANGQAFAQFETTAGSILGLPGVVANQPYSLTAVAQKGAQVLFVSREQFANLMKSDSNLSFRILQILAAEVRTARRALYE